MFLPKRLGLIKLIHLRPTFASIKEMKHLINIALEEKQPVLNMMIHSNELSSGTSPYVSSESELRAVFKKCADIFSYIREIATPVMLKDVTI